MLKLLLTNDDGIDAPGLASLYEAVSLAFADQPHEIVVVAPDRCRSECGHGVTTGRPLGISERRPGWFAVDGTPVDCVRAALATVAADVAAVFSGVNSGANLGIDLLVSGTFAAAREASLHGIPAMALSHYRRPDVARRWEHVPDWLRETLADFAQRLALHPVANGATADADNGRSATAEPGLLWNVNLPAAPAGGAVPPRKWCGVDPSPLRRRGSLRGGQVTFELDFHGRPRRPGDDVDHCFLGCLTISEVSPNVHGLNRPFESSEKLDMGGPQDQDRFGAGNRIR